MAVDQKSTGMCSAGQSLLGFMSTLRQQDVMCDVELKAKASDDSEQSISVHKVVLLYFSQYFRDQISSDSENSTEVISFETLPYETLCTVIRLMYQEIVIDDVINDEEVVKALIDLQIDLHDDDRNKLLLEAYNELMKPDNFESINDGAKQDVQPSSINEEVDSGRIEPISMETPLKEDPYQEIDSDCDDHKGETHDNSDTLKRNFPSTDFTQSENSDCDDNKGEVQNDSDTLSDPSTDHTQCENSSFSITNEPNDSTSESKNVYIRVLVPKPGKKGVTRSSFDAKILQMCKNKLIKTRLTPNDCLKSYSKRRRGEHCDEKTSTNCPLRQNSNGTDDSVPEKRVKTGDTTYTSSESHKSHVNPIEPNQNTSNAEDTDDSARFDATDGNDLNVELDRIKDATEADTIKHANESQGEQMDVHVESHKGETEDASVNMDVTKQELTPKLDSLHEITEYTAEVKCEENREEKIKEYKGRRDCDICGKSLPCKAVFDRHRLIHTGEKPWKCDICGKAFNAKTNLKSHQKTHEKRERAFTCDICGSKFYSLHTLQHHERSVHVEAKEFVECDVCGKQLKTIYNLRAHKQIAHSEPSELLQCKICERKFKTRAYLLKHLRLHENEKPYPCRECDESFRSNSAREKHENVVHKQQIFVCEVCGNSYYTKAVLSAHITRTHYKEEDGNPLTRECLLCHKKVGNYYNHMKMHRSYEKGELHECKECGKTFPLKAYLHQHMKVHKEGNHKFRCNNCEKNFNFKSSLQSHLKQGQCNRLSTVNRGRFAKNKTVKEKTCHMVLRKSRESALAEQQPLPVDAAYTTRSESNIKPEPEVKTVTLVVTEAMLQQLQQQTAEVTFQPDGAFTSQPTIVTSSQMINATPNLNLSTSTRYNVVGSEGELPRQTHSIPQQILTSRGIDIQAQETSQQFIYKEEAPISVIEHSCLGENASYIQPTEINNQLHQVANSSQSYVIFETNENGMVNESQIVDPIPEYLDSNLAADFYQPLAQTNTDLQMEGVTNSTMATHIPSDTLSSNINDNGIAVIDQSTHSISDNMISIATDNGNLITIQNEYGSTATSTVHSLLSNDSKEPCATSGDIDTALQSERNQLIVSSEDLAELNRIVTVMHTMKEHDGENNVQYVIVPNSST